MGKYANKYNIPIGKIPFFRKILYKQFTTEKLYKKLHSKPFKKRKNRFIIQDCYLPHNKTKRFLNYVDRELEIYPIWLCPVKSTKKKVNTYRHITAFNSLL